MKLKLKLVLSTTTNGGVRKYLQTISTIELFTCNMIRDDKQRRGRVVSTMGQNEHCYDDVDGSS